MSVTSATAFALTGRAGPGGRTVVGVRGELDIATAERLVRYTRPWIRPGGEIVVDLSELSFCDCVGLTALARIADHADSAGCRFALAAPQPIVARVLSLGGMDRRLTLTDAI